MTDDPRPRRRGPRAIAAVLLVVLAVAGSTQASASTAHAHHSAGTAVRGDPPTASASDTTVDAGQVITVRAEHLAPGGAAAIDFLPVARRLGTATADAEGRVSAPVTIPSDIPSGDYQIVVTATDTNGNYAYLPIDVTVHAPPASTSVSDRTVAPGQVVVVEGHRFQPGSTVAIDLVPTARLTEVTVGATGGFTTSTTIPADTVSGKYQIVVTGVGADGRYAYVATDMTVQGEPASVTLSAERLVPGQHLTISGRRFQPGRDIQVDLLPTARLGPATVRLDGTFDASFQLADDLVPGGYKVVVTGFDADGKYTYLSTDVVVRRDLVGSTDRGALDLGDPSSTTSTLPRRERTRGDGDGGPSAAWWVLAIALILLLCILLPVWWRRRRRARRED